MKRVKVSIGDLERYESYGDANPRNRKGRCAKLPKEFGLERLDDAFYFARKGQVGAGRVGATRIAAAGWYEGAPEKSATYEVAFIPSKKEPTFEKFKRNIRKLGEILREGLCQDSVLIYEEEGGRKVGALVPRKRKKP